MFDNNGYFLVFFLVISVNRRLFRYFGSYSGISVIPVILINRRTGLKSIINGGAYICTLMFSAILTKANNFYYFRVAYLDGVALPKWILLSQERISS